MVELPFQKVQDYERKGLPILPPTAIIATLRIMSTRIVWPWLL